jgi:glycosyltransferase involved in cell wall biosynthesis
VRAAEELLTCELADPDAEVLVVTNMWPDAEKPAYGIFVQRQVAALRALGIRCEVLYLRGYRSPLAYLVAALALFRLNFARRARYRLVHAHGGEVALSVRAFLRGPVAVTYCGGDLNGTIDHSGRLTRGSRVRRPLLRAQSRLLSATITQSREMENYLPRRVRRRNAVIPNGVDVALFAPMDRLQARRQLGWPEDGRVALFAANPGSGGSKTARRIGRADKRYWLAEEACAEAAESLPGLRLEAAAGVPPADMPLLMNAADCLLLTSAAEGSPNVVKEAIACNLPVVTTRVGDVEDLLAGVEPSYVCDDTPAALAAALVDCLREPRRSDGRERAERFSQPEVARRVAAVYSSLVPSLRRDG